MPHLPARRVVGLAVTTVLMSTVLSACGGSSYCDAVEQHEAQLTSFGKTRTDKAYTGYQKAVADIAKVAPPTVKDDYTRLAKALSGVLSAQSAVELDLSQMQDREQVSKLSSDQLTQVNAAYTSFNETRDATGDAIVKNVKQECEITL